MEKPLRTAWVFLKAGCGGSSRHHQVGANSMSQVDGVSYMMLACLPALWEEGSEKEQQPMPALLSRRKLPPPSLTRMLDNSVSSCLSLMPLNLLPHAGVQREWIQVRTCIGPFRETAWYSSSPLSPQTQSPLVFIARSYWHISSWLWNPGLGSLGWDWELSLLKGSSAAKITLPIFIYHTWVWDQLHGGSASPIVSK